MSGGRVRLGRAGTSGGLASVMLWARACWQPGAAPEGGPEMPRLCAWLRHRLQPSPSAPSPVQRELGWELRAAGSISGRDRRDRPSLHTYRGSGRGHGKSGISPDSPSAVLSMTASSAGISRRPSSCQGGGIGQALRCGDGGAGGPCPSSLQVCKVPQPPRPRTPALAGPQEPSGEHREHPEGQAPCSPSGCARIVRFVAQ